jgi:SAM-dependent methyltransferase
MFNNALGYEGYVGRWSRLVAAQFVQWLGVPASKDWFDLGAGTGILTQIILQQAAPRKVLGMDLSESYITLARENVIDQRVEFKVEDATSLTAKAPEYDVAVSGLMLNFLPDPQQTLRTMQQLVKPDGVVASYVWDYGGKMEMMRHFWDAAIAIDPSAAQADAGKRFAICDPDHLYAAFVETGLHQVDLRPIDIPTRFKDFDDYWLPFLAAQGSISKYLTSLDEAGVSAITAKLREQLPIISDGSIELTARAWAAKGIR